MALDLGDWLPRGLAWLRPIIERALGVSAARPELEKMAHLEGKEFVDAVVAALRVEPRCLGSVVGGVPAIPEEGALLVVSNHHFGLLDPLLVLSLLLPVRPDLKVVANRALKDLVPQLGELVIPVAPPSVRHRRIDGTREVLRHLRGGGALLIFPAGQVAGRGRGGVEDGPWPSKVGRIVHGCRAAVLPVAFEGQNSALFYLARSVHFSLGTFLLLRELLSKAGRRVPVHVGPPVPYEKLADLADLGELAERLRSMTYEPLYRRRSPQSEAPKDLAG